tara:strand:- start:761 stop:1414 length:654 start_codon:yes stop_codon:yes gene_type:complete
MAVLGGKQYNKDPKTLLRTSHRNESILYFIDGTDINAANSVFWGSNALFHDAVTTSAYSADTVKQIVSISGSSGFFYGAISPQQYALTSYVTWTIVVDGVTSTIVQGQGTKDDEDFRFTLGSIFNNFRSSATSFSRGMPGGLNLADNDPAWDDAHGSINLNYGSSSNFTYMGLPGMVGDADQKVFFANSLVVSCTPDVEPSSGTVVNDYSGVVYQLL